MTRVAIITRRSGLEGGVKAMIVFLRRVLAESGRYEPHIISLATSRRDSANVLVSSPRSEVAPCGVDTACFRPAESRPPGQLQYILSVARFSDPRKNLRLLIEAYDQFWSPTAPELWLAGEREISRHRRSNRPMSQ